MAQDRTLSVEPRERTGTTSAHALRRAGKIPAVVYGHGTRPQHVAVDARIFSEVVHHGGAHGLITLIDGSRRETAMVREIQRNPVSQRIDHIDLQRVGAHESVRTKVGIVTTGVAMGVRDFAGVLDVLVHEIEIEGPVDEVPDHLEVDVSKLGIHQHALAADVNVPKHFKVLTPPDTIVVSVEPSKTARLLEEAETAPAEAAQPELIGKPEEPE